MIPLLVLETSQNMIDAHKSKHMQNDIHRVKAENSKQAYQVYVKTIHLTLMYLETQMSGINGLVLPNLRTF